MNENDSIESNEIEKRKTKYMIEPIGEIFNKRIKTYKVIIVGDSGVGKTCISFRVLKNKFNDKLSATVSLDVFNYQFKINGKIIQIQFWDTCGNEEFARNTPNLFKNTSIAIIVYAINNKKSFENVNSWNNILNDYSFECIKYLIGNKADLENEREVSKEEGEKLKENYGFSNFIESSAKTGINIIELLENISISIYEKYVKNNADNNSADSISLRKEDLKKNKKNKNKRNNCCE